MAQQFFGGHRIGMPTPGFAHQPRWRTDVRCQAHCSRPTVEAPSRPRTSSAELLGDAARRSSRDWSPLAQDQYLEIRTLLSSYLLCSQGDRMLMAHSVEGRFPFLDIERRERSRHSLPPRYKLRVLDEKHVLKRVAQDLAAARDPRAHQAAVPRAGRALRSSPTRPSGGGSSSSTCDEIAKVGVFDPATVEALWKKVPRRRDDAQLSNTDNMALVGVLSTQLLYETSCTARVGRTGRCTSRRFWIESSRRSSARA